MNKIYNAAYLEHLQVLLADTKKHSYTLLNCIPGEVIVDVGCGLGHDTAALAQSGATLIGLDHNAELLTKARDQYGHIVAFHQRSAEATGLVSGSVDKIRFDRVLQHIANEELALAEVKRVLTPNGLIQIIDTDYQSFSFFLPDVQFERKLIEAILNRLNGARRFRLLPAALCNYGFGPVTLAVHQVLVEGFDQANAIIRLDKIVHEEAAVARFNSDELEMWTEWKQSGRCFLSMNQVILQACKIT